MRLRGNICWKKRIFWFCCCILTFTEEGWSHCRNSLHFFLQGSWHRIDFSEATLRPAIEPEFTYNDIEKNTGEWIQVGFQNSEGLVTLAFGKLEKDPQGRVGLRDFSKSSLRHFDESKKFDLNDPKKFESKSVLLEVSGPVGQDSHAFVLGNVRSVDLVNYQFEISSAEPAQTTFIPFSRIHRITDLSEFRQAAVQSEMKTLLNLKDSKNSVDKNALQLTLVGVRWETGELVFQKDPVLKDTLLVKIEQIGVFRFYSDLRTFQAPSE